MKYIERPEYMQRLLDLMGTPDIKIITGVRRSGKSELMKAYIRRITETQPDANIIFVDFFDLKYKDLKEYHALYNYIESQYDPDRTMFSLMRFSFAGSLSWQSTACMLHGNMISTSPDPMPSC